MYRMEQTETVWHDTDGNTYYLSSHNCWAGTPTIVLQATLDEIESMDGLDIDDTIAALREEIAGRAAHGDRVVYQSRV